MSDKDVKIGDCEAFITDGKCLNIFTGDYEYGCSMKISEWETVKLAIDKMISNTENGEGNA